MGFNHLGTCIRILEEEPLPTTAICLEDIILLLLKCYVVMVQKSVQHRPQSTCMA